VAGVISEALPSIRVAAFRRFLLEDSLAGSGLWILQIALAWTILDRTGSGTVVGLVQTAELLPIPLAIALGGILTDRFGPRRLMYVSWTIPGAVAAAYALTASQGLLSVPLALALMLVSGFFIGLYVVPAQVYVARCVEPSTMAHAIGFSQVTIGVGRVMGGAAAGVALALAGRSNSFLLAAAAFISAAAVCMSMPDISGAETHIGNVWKGLGRGFRAVVESKTMTAVTVLGSVSALFIYSYLAVTPLVVRHLIGGGAARLGMLTAAGGIGAIIAALLMDAVGRSIGRGRLLAWSLGVAGLAVVCLGASRIAVVSLLIAVVLSASTVTFSATSVLLLQASSDLRVRGRVLGLFNGLFYVLLPLSGGLAGFSSDRVGVTTVLAITGSLAVLSAVVAMLSSRELMQQYVDGAGRAARLGVVQPLAPTGELHVLPAENPSL
jgi:MFS family permease